MKPRQPTNLSAAKKNYQQGNYPQAMQDAMAVYQRAVRAADQATIADAANLIGLVTLAQERASNAMPYFKKSLQINQRLNNKKRMAANLLNISLVHSDLKELDSAIAYIQSSIRLSREQKLPDLIAMGKNHLGDYYVRQGKYRAAEGEFKSVLNDRKYRSDWEASFASTGLARVYFANKRFQEAARFADLGYASALKADAKWDAAKALEIAHQAYSSAGNVSKAYERLLDFKLIRDSLFNTSKDKELHQLELKANAVENENLLNHVKIANQDRKIERLMFMVLLVGFSLLLTIALLIYRSRRLVVLKNRQLIAEHAATVLQKQGIELQNDVLNLVNKDHERLFSILGHDLRGPFSSIENTLMLFRSGDLSHEEFQSLAEKLAAQVNTASSMLNSLLIWSANQMGGISFSAVEVDLVMKVEKVIGFSQAAAGYKGITIQHTVSDLPKVIGDADQVRIMIQNLVSNAVKFTKLEGTIRIHYELGDDYVDLHVQDNGVGMSEEKLQQVLSGRQLGSTYGTGNEKGIGLGLQLVREFAAKNAITFMGKSRLAEGTTLTLRFHNILNS